MALYTITKGSYATVMVLAQTFVEMKDEPVRHILIVACPVRCDTNESTHLHTKVHSMRQKSLTVVFVLIPERRSSQTRTLRPAHAVHETTPPVLAVVSGLGPAASDQSAAVLLLLRRARRVSDNICCFLTEKYIYTYTQTFWNIKSTLSALRR